MSEKQTGKDFAYNDLSEDELRILAQIPELPTPQDVDDKSRTQVNISRSTHELVKLWLEDDRAGTVKDMCDRGVRLWLMVYANVIKQESKPRFSESQTGTLLKLLADRVKPDVSAEFRDSPSVRQGHVVRIATHIATCLLSAKGVRNPDNDMYHELFQAARESGRRVGDEVAERLRLASLLLSICPDAAGAGSIEELKRHLGKVSRHSPSGGK